MERYKFQLEFSVVESSSLFEACQPTWICLADQRASNLSSWGRISFFLSDFQSVESDLLVPRLHKDETPLRPLWASYHRKSSKNHHYDFWIGFVDQKICWHFLHSHVRQDVPSRRWRELSQDFNFTLFHMANSKCEEKHVAQTVVRLCREQQSTLDCVSGEQSHSWTFTFTYRAPKSMLLHTSQTVMC